MRARRTSGFTLVELVVVITIMTIIVGILAMLIATPVQAYFAQTRRAMLVDSANSARRMIASDVRGALPNSARSWSNGNIRMLELLATTYTAAYYSEPPLSPHALLDLTPGGPDADFATVGLFSGLGPPLPPSTGYVVINNLGTPPAADAYAQTNVIAPVNLIAASNAPPPAPVGQPIDNVHLNPAFTFVADSPKHRVFLVAALPAVAYLCDQAAQTLTRYWGYAISANPGAHDSAAKMAAAGAQSALVAQNVTSCTFTAPLGTPQYGQLVRVQMLLSSSGENLPVMEEVSEDNPS